MPETALPIETMERVRSMLTKVRGPVNYRDMTGDAKPHDAEEEPKNEEKRKYEENKGVGAWASDRDIA